MNGDSALGRIAGVASRVRTPLGLAGLTVVVLYALYRQVLGLQVFENVGSQSTAQLLNAVIDRVFLVAILATLIAGLAYLIPIVRTRPEAQVRSSHIELIDASLDASENAYEESIENGIRTIRPRAKDGA